MESSHQQPSDKHEQQAGSAPESAELQPGESAFFEYPAEAHLQSEEAGATSPSPAAEQVVPVEASAEAIQAGLIYPPPPSFYQNLPVSDEKPPLPTSAPGVLPPPLQQAQAFVPYTGYQFHPGMPPVQTRGSRKKYWIILSILAGTLVLSCGLCSWLAYTFLQPVVLDATSIRYLVTDYYENIEQADYESAYHYLQVENLSQAAFIEQAQQRDNELGAVSSFQITAASPHISDTSNSEQPAISAYTTTISVVRGTAEAYLAHLELTHLGDVWRIVSFDLI